MESLLSVLVLAQVLSVCNQFHGLGKLLLYILRYIYVYIPKRKRFGSRDIK